MKTNVKITFTDAMVADRGEVPTDGGGGGGGGGEGQDRHVLHQLLAHPDID